MIEEKQVNTKVMLYFYVILISTGLGYAGASAGSIWAARYSPPTLKAWLTDPCPPEVWEPKADRRTCASAKLSIMICDLQGGDCRRNSPMYTARLSGK